MRKEAIMHHGIGPADSVTPNNAAGNSQAPSAQLTDVPPSGVPAELSLRRVLPAARFACGDDVRVRSIADSPATAAPGDLIVYRIGQDDPVRVVAAALARGASGILSEQLLPCPLPQCIVGDVELAIAKITAEQLQRPDRKLLTIGVVGSAGKTSTALLLSTLLRASGIRVGYQTDLGSCDGCVQTTAPEPLPHGAKLVQWLAEADDAGACVAVIELSADQARYGHYDAIELDMVVVTGASVGNGDFGPSGLQCVLERMAEDGVIIAPVDDPRAMRVIQEQSLPVVSYGVRKHADVTAKIIDQSGGMSTLLVTHQDTTAVMETSLCGGAMAANHAAATAVGLLLNQPLPEILERLGQLRSIPGRGQRLTRPGRPTVVVDVGGTPERVATALRTFRSMKSAGRLWCIQAIDPGEQPEVLAHYGNLIERFADRAIVTCQPHAKAAFLAGTHAVLDGVEQCAALRCVADQTRAIQWAISEAGPRDTILVITGRANRTPREQRADLQRIEAMVHEAWGPELAEESGGTNQPPVLKVYG